MEAGHEENRKGDKENLEPVGLLPSNVKRKKRRRKKAANPQWERCTSDLETDTAGLTRSEPRGQETTARRRTTRKIARKKAKRPILSTDEKGKIKKKTGR